MITSSIEAAHGLLEIVHLNIKVVPAEPVNVDVGLPAVVTVPPAPDTMLHEPVPVVGKLPLRFTELIPHVVAPVRSGPAFAEVGAVAKVISTSSLNELHAFVTVHLKV